MPSPERLTAECPRCGEVFETWAIGTPDLDSDPALFAASEVTCPHCGCTACSSGLAAERQAWRTGYAHAMDLEGVTIRRREDLERTGNWLLVRRSLGVNDAAPLSSTRRGRAPLAISSSCVCSASRMAPLR